MSSPILIYCPFESPRLQYVLDWVIKSQLGLSYSLVNTIPDSGAYISYGVSAENAISIPSSKLLENQGIRKQQIKTGDWNSIPTLYTTDDTGYTIPFDIFSAIFFLISRYEEYYTFSPDKHGRYPATDSILYKHGWLERPLIDEWIASFRLLVAKYFNIPIPEKNFSFLPTYDIDIAWSYKNKGFVRTVGGFSKDLINGKWRNVLQRLNTIVGIAKDPYYSFAEIARLHKTHKYNPFYFVLAALHSGQFDKNISPINSEMKKLIQSFSNEGILGVHPSYNSNQNNTLLTEEKNILENISGITISQSRQHYIRLWFPHSYRQLINAGISDDHSMGYGTHLGFRAGTGNTFKWYDIENEQVTSIYIHPFCFMDSTAHYDLNLSAEEAFERLEKMTALLRKTNSVLTTVFHNFSLGTDTEWNGWAEKYSRFLAKMAR